MRRANQSASFNRIKAALFSLLSPDPQQLWALKIRSVDVESFRSVLFVKGFVLSLRQLEHL
jgi:hypothetical protein